MYDLLVLRPVSAKIHFNQHLFTDSAFVSVKIF